MENPNCDFLSFYLVNILKMSMGMYPQIVINILVCHKDIYYSQNLKAILIIADQSIRIVCA